MRILLVTDSWAPQVNGVVRTWQAVADRLTALGHQIDVIHPNLFRTFPMPRYPEIRLALLPGRALKRLMSRQAADCIHIATEGPLGMAARRFCLREQLAFTTSYHTNLPDYVRRYTGMPRPIIHRFIRWFHGAARCVLVPTRSIADELQRRCGLDNTVVWSRGVDTTLFNRRHVVAFDLPRPIFLYAGRVSSEKNLDAFLSLGLPGSKVVVGDGPCRRRLERAFPAAHFVGYRFGPELAAHYAGADVFVFPSRNDTFGVVMLEANACGLPVAACPVKGPIDVIEPGVNGCLNDDLRMACLDALRVDRNLCMQQARRHDWARCADIFLEHLCPLAQTRLEAVAPAS